MEKFWFLRRKIFSCAPIPRATTTVVLTKRGEKTSKERRKTNDSQSISIR
nr:MAG TPA_asm: hypothetical protein [Picobirnaviridae sp.]